MTRTVRPTTRLDLPSEPGSPLRVLIADDQKDARRNARVMLSLVPGVEVVAMARNGKEAVALADEHHPHIAIMDINMPEMDGISAIAAMRKHHPDLACIVISAEKDNQTLRDAMAAGARAYLIKPFTSSELLDAIRRVGHDVWTGRRRTVEARKLRQERNQYLLQLAREYAKDRRTDDEALGVFEELAGDTACEPRWLSHLAMIYVIRGDWSKLKFLAARLEEGHT